MPAQKRGSEAAEDGDPVENHRENGLEEPQDGEESDRSRSPEPSEDEKDDQKPEYVAVRLSEIRKEVQCPICLGIIRKTRTVMECLHRFCRECIDKSMRLGNNECPACRTHCASRRSLRDDPKYDALIAAIYPDIDKYEEEELAFHEEEKARNKQIQASIAQTFRRQSEALGRKRTTAKATAAAFMRSQGNYKNLRRRRNHKNTVEIQGSDDNEEANGNDGGKDSSSGDERKEPRPKRPKRWAGARYYQPSSATANADGDDENDYEVNREVIGASVGFVGSPERLAWGKGGMRSHTRYGSSSGANGKNARNRLSKLVDYLRNSEANDKGLDIHLLLVSFDEQRIPSLQRPYLCCSPTLSVGQLCQYVAAQTALQPDEVQIYFLKELQAKVNPSDPTNASVSTSGVLDSSKDTLLLLRDDELLGEVQVRHLIRGHLLLAYQKKWNLNRG
ncbi:putative E3 ubiquitin-protein ligase RING1a [Rosa sericea]